jgi:hypothetical protein
MMRNLCTNVVLVLFIFQLTASCTQCDCDKEKTYSLSLSEADSGEVEVIDLKKCQYGGTSCIVGKSEGKPYRFGFANDPNVLIGTIGDVKHELYLSKDKVESYGNGILEMPFINNETGVMIIVNWSSKKNRFIGHDFHALVDD